MKKGMFRLSVQFTWGGPTHTGSRSGVTGFWLGRHQEQLNGQRLLSGKQFRKGRVSSSDSVWAFTSRSARA